MKEILNIYHTNYQSHSGSQSNMTVLFSILKSDEKILALNLSNEIYLTHDCKLNFSGIRNTTHFYEVSTESEILDYIQNQKIADKVETKLILVDGSIYFRKIDIRNWKDIANSVDVILPVDMTQIAEVVTTGLHQNSMFSADVTTCTS